ncbi:MAG: alpha/beta hydrolase [Magnetospirillum sp.]|nr:alpha/beta hydrolase [Magnetospirillum sp.]
MIGEIVAVFAGGLVLAMGGLAFFQRDMIYHPGREKVAPADAGVPEMVPVTIRSHDGFMNTGWYGAPRDRFQPTIVYFHGNAGTVAHRAHKARLFLDEGFGVLLVGYRGYGGNPGSPSEEGLYSDARAALGWLISRGVPQGQIVLYGESLGTGVAVQMATEHVNVVGVVLEAPYTRLPDLAPVYVLPGFAEMVMLDRFDNRAKIGQIRSPLLILHGQQDGVVPVDMGRELKERARMGVEAHFIAAAGHNDLYSHGAGQLVADFIRKQLEP